MQFIINQIYMDDRRLKKSKNELRKAIQIIRNTYLNATLFADSQVIIEDAGKVAVIRQQTLSTEFRLQSGNIFVKH